MRIKLTKKTYLRIRKDTYLWANSHWLSDKLPTTPQDNLHSQYKIIGIPKLCE